MDVAAAPAQDEAPVDARACAALLHASVQEGRRLVAEQMNALVRWADLHNPDVHRARERLAAEGGSGWRMPRRVQPGGAGTPQVTDTAVNELGLLLETSTGSARRYLADCLDLCHRLPATWAGARSAASTVGRVASSPPPLVTSARMRRLGSTSRS